MRLGRFSLFFFIVIWSSVSWAFSRDTLDISGEWYYRLIGAPSQIPGEGEIQLPNTLDNTRKSIYNPECDNTAQLRREFSFIGEAVYSKEIHIPSEWEGKDIVLHLERTKPAVVKIDGRIAGYNSRISSPQRYNVSNILSPGSHFIEISVNNADSIPPIVARSSHAVSESTQTNWNGILGDMFFEARNPFHVEGITIDDDQKNIKLQFSKSASKDLFCIFRVNGEFFSKVRLEPESANLTLPFPIENSALWRADNPVLYNLSFTIEDTKGQVIDRYEVKTGLRQFKTSGKTLMINGNPVFLRGTVNAAVFPNTVTPPLDKEGWIHYFSILKEFGFNHVRFHSWTPPDAAFKAADETGVYIMTELPIWGELDRDLKFHNRFLREELKGVMEAYAHHPSFIMFSNGNELWGDLSLMGEYMIEARNLNPRILATQGSNVYLGMNGEIGGEDFIVSSKTGDGDSNFVRGAMSFADSSAGGYINSHYPNSLFDYKESLEGLNVPLISHETGQYQTYPDFNEIKKYNGYLKPDNLKEFQKRAMEAGTYRKNRDFVEASGKWASRLYKAEMEAAQRTEGISGYQLFGLQDYPGQGTSLVGILDPFMDSKGFITPDKWRQSAGDILILAEFPKFTFESGEEIEIGIDAVNYTINPDTIKEIEWHTFFDGGKISIDSCQGLKKIGNIKMRIPDVNVPMKMELSLKEKGSEIENRYDFWVYPKKIEDQSKVIVTQNLEEALNLLKEGRHVILCPDSSSVSKASIDPLFITDFWNYRMYRTICDEMHIQPSPGTLGLLINESHPAISKFPTANHTDWQWYSIISHSRPLIIDRLPKDFDPIVEVIDNVERNFRLALMLECNVGKGKLMILSVDPEKISQYPEGRWLLQSIKDYLGSKDCNPLLTLSAQQIRNLITKPSTARMVKELKNETYRRF